LSQFWEGDDLQDDKGRQKRSALGGKKKLKKNSFKKLTEFRKKSNRPTIFFRGGPHRGRSREESKRVTRGGLTREET